jgi:hypothetical protein
VKQRGKLSELYVLTLIHAPHDARGTCPGTEHRQLPSHKVNRRHDGICVTAATLWRGTEW